MQNGIGSWRACQKYAYISIICPCPVSSFFKPSLTGLVPCNRVLSQWRREGSTTVKDLEEDGDKDVAVVGGGGGGGWRARARVRARPRP